MKRTPLKRKKGLRGSGKLAPRKPMKRGKPLKAKGKRRFPKGEDRKFQVFIRNQPCFVAGRTVKAPWPFEHVCQGIVQASHIRSKGAGGCDEGNLLPLCAGTHSWQHEIGIKSWCANYSLTMDDLVLGAQHLWVAYEKTVLGKSL